MAKRQSGAKMVKKVAIKKVDDSNLVVSQEIRAALIEMNDHQASSKAVAQFLREKHPNSAKVAKATSGTAWSIYVSNERRRAASQLGREYLGRVAVRKSRGQGRSGRDVVSAPTNDDLYRFWQNCEENGIDPQSVASFVKILKSAGSAENARIMAERINALRSQIKPDQIKAVLATMAGKPIE